VNQDVLLVLVVIVALFFDFTNGFNDSANAIATGISTRAWHPRLAVLVAAALNFAGAFAVSKVATTVAKGIVDPAAITPRVVLAGLIGAITWNLCTWYFGLPSSSTHALIGGTLGSAVAAVGFSVVNWHNLYEKVLIPALCAPTFGGLGGAAFITVILWIVRRRSPGVVNHVFRRLQLVSSSFLAYTHGTNDAQKTMGIISLALISTGHLSPDFTRPPVWVIASAALAIAAGTYAGGWRIIRTLGQRIVKLLPPQGFSAEAATGLTLYFTAHFGFPVSTTHTISGGVLGAGAAGGTGGVRWRVARNILFAWLLTIPCAATVGAAMQAITRIPGGAVIVFGVGIGIASIAFAARTRTTRELEPQSA
jgi:PiT family inorganic phosphate transporter